VQDGGGLDLVGTTIFSQGKRAPGTMLIPVCPDTGTYPGHTVFVKDLYEQKSTV
jgi:hypothetical protein